VRIMAIDSSNPTITVTGSAPGVQAAVKAIAELQAALAKTVASLSTVGTISKEATASLEGVGVASAAVTKNVTALNTAIANEAVSTEASIKAHRSRIATLEAENAAIGRRVAGEKSLAFGLADSAGYTRQNKDATLEWTRAINRNGAQLVSSMEKVNGYEIRRAGTLREVFQNQKLLNASMRQGYAGIASGGTVASASLGRLGSSMTGATSKFQASLGVFDRMRLKTTALKNDLHSMFQTMQRGAKQMQWIGRQMMMGISIPLAAFGTLAVYSFTKLTKEQARLQKLTYETGEAFEDGAKRIKDYAPAIRDISREFGQVESITTAVAGDWAAMGFDLDENNEQMTRLTSQWALLGGMDLSATTDWIRVVYATFGDNNLEKTKELLNQLNTAEEVSAINLSDMADAMPHVAQSADKYNMSAAQLAATLATMVEAGIDANSAAHALKFSLQRMYNPTGKAKEALDAMGIAAFDSSGNAKDAIDLLKEIGTTLPNFNEEFQAQAIGDIFASRQVDRVMAALKGITSETSDYNRVIEATSASTEELQQKTDAQVEAMQNSPAFQLQKLKAEFTMLLTDVGEFLTPFALKFLESLNKLIKRLNELPNSAKLALGALLTVGAAIGPVVYVFSVVGEAFATVGLGLAKILPGLYEVTGATEGLMDASGKLRGKVIQLGDAEFLIGGKRKKNAIELEIMNEALQENQKKEIELRMANTAAIKAEQEAIQERMREAAIASSRAINDEMAELAVQSQQEDAIGDLLERRRAAWAVESEAYPSTRSTTGSIFRDTATGAPVAREVGEAQQAIRRELGLTTSAMEAMIDEATDYNREFDRIMNEMRLMGAPVPSYATGPAMAAKKAAQEALDAQREELALASTLRRAKSGKWQMGGHWASAEAVERARELLKIHKDDVNLTRRQAAEVKRALAALGTTGVTSAMRPIPMPAAPIPTIDIETPARADGALRRFVSRFASSGRNAGKSFWVAFMASLPNAISTPLAASGGFIRKNLDRLLHPKRTVQNIGARVATSWTEGLLANMRSPKIKDRMQSLMGKIKGKGGADGAAGAANAAGLAGSLGKLAGSLTTILVVIAIIAVVVAALAVPFLAIKKHFWSFKKEAQKGLETLKKSWEKFKEAMTKVADAIKRGFSEALGLKGTKKEQGRELAKKFGEYAKAIMNFIAKIVDAISWALGVIEPFFEWIGHVMGSSMQFMTDLFSGHFMDAMGSFGQVLYAVLGEPIAGVMDWIIDLVIQSFRWIIIGAANLVETLTSVFDAIPFIDNPFQGVVDGIRDAGDALDEFAAAANVREWANGYFFTGGRGRGDEAADEANEMGRYWGQRLVEGVEEGLDEGGSGSGSLEETTDDWLSGWLSAVKSRLDSVIQELKDQATKALEDRFKANLEVFDNQIKAIDELEKREARALAAKKYREDRKAMIEERALQRQNYLRDRALAIYEGRIDDARMMDLEERKNKKEAQKNLANLDAERKRELLQQERDHQKEMLQIQKDALDARQQLMLEAFQKQLDAITEYAPRTIAEFQSMLNNMTGLLGAYGIEVWPGMMATGMGLFSQVIADANEDVVQQAAWSGKSAATAWLAAFISGDAKAALTEGQSEAPIGRNVGNQGASGGGGGGQRWVRWRTPDTGVGASRYYHTGGFLGSGPPADIPITAQTGEYMIQRDAVNAVGLPFLNSINNAHKYHTGGLIEAPQAPRDTASTPIGKIMDYVLPSWVKNISDRWMQSRYDDPTKSTGWSIGGADPSKIFGAFQGGGTVGGKKLSDFMPTFMSGEGEPIQQFANWINATFPGLHAATGIGTHSWNVAGTDRVSLHSLKRAVDVSGAVPLMGAFFNAMLQHGRSGSIPIQELIYQHMGWYGSDPIRNYSKSDHFDHVHVGLRDGFASLMGAFGVTQPTASGILGGSTPGGYGIKSYVRTEFARRFGDHHWGALDQLISHESGWNPSARNPSSGAYGLFQFMPLHFGGPLLPSGGSAGVPEQVRGGMDYIGGKYGNPSNAWAFWQRTDPRPYPGHWYHNGGLIEPVKMAMGGIVPFDNYPALLHKNEMVMPAKLSQKVQEGGGGTTVNIYADTFLGDSEWFAGKMEEYDVKVVPKNNRVSGSVNRRVSKR